MFEQRRERVDTRRQPTLKTGNQVEFIRRNTRTDIGPVHNYISELDDTEIRARYNRTIYKCYFFFLILVKSVVGELVAASTKT